MSGRVIRARVLDKKVEMKNRENSKVSISTTSSRETAFTGGSSISSWTPTVNTHETRRVDTTFYNYTVTSVKLSEEGTDKIHEIMIVADEFLPPKGKSIDVFVSDSGDLGAVAYSPYAGAEPIALESSPAILSLTELMGVIALLFFSAAPVMGLYFIYICIRYPLVIFKNGVVKKTNLTWFYAALIGASQVYILYMFYKHGRSVFFEMAEIWIAVGAIGAICVLCVTILNNIRLASYIRCAMKELANKDARK